MKLYHNLLLQLFYNYTIIYSHKVVGLNEINLVNMTIIKGVKVIQFYNIFYKLV